MLSRKLKSSHLGLSEMDSLRNLFEGLQHGFDFAEYQQKGGWIEEREALRQRHYEGFVLSRGSLVLGALRKVVESYGEDLWISIRYVCS